MRYFLVTFSLSDKFSLGTICFESDGFFSYEQLMQIVRLQQPYAKGIVVMNIYEFSSVLDYTKYKGETPTSELAEYVQRVRQILMKTYHFPPEKTSFINEGNCKEYFEMNLPESEALVDIMQKRLNG